MKLLYLVPGPMDRMEIKRRQEICNNFTSKNTEVIVEDTEGPLSIESSVEESLVLGPLLKKIWLVQKDYNAIIIGCFGDPGLRGAREISNIPVIGPGEASMHFACLVGDDFSIITVLESTIHLAQEQVRFLGLESKLKSIRAINIPVLELEKNFNNIETFQELIEDIEKKDKSGSIILGCMSQAFLLLDERTKSRIPVINPVKVALKSAELFVSLNIRPSPFSYPPANIRKLEAILGRR